MSQRSEKYARNMERRVGKLERTVEQITTEQVRQSSHISVLEDDLAVYRAAVAERDLREAAERPRNSASSAVRQRRPDARTPAPWPCWPCWWPWRWSSLALIGCRVSAAERDQAGRRCPLCLCRPHRDRVRPGGRAGLPGGHHGAGGGRGPYGGGENRGGPAGPGLFLPGGPHAL